MNNTSLGSITLQQIEIFLSVAESKNFTTTANRLNMTQPGVSKSIATLEQLLGFPLFVRTSRKVELTKEGLLLYEKWNPIKETVHEGYDLALNNYHKRNSTLNIGVTDTTDPSRYFWPLIHHFSKEHPDISLNIESDNMIALQKDFPEKYDVIFIPDFEHYTLDEHHIPWKYVARNNVQIIMLLDNPLSQKKYLQMKDILDAEVTSLDPDINPNFLRALEDLYEPYGRKPIITAFYSSNFQIQSAQFLKQCIHITDDFWNYIPNNISKKIPLKNHYNGIICAWNQASTKPGLKTFLKTLPDLR